MSKETVGIRIKEARKAKKITQKELARILNCSHTTVSKYEQGEIENMPRPRMKMLAEVLEVSPTILFELEEKPTDKSVDELSPAKRELIAKVMQMSDEELQKFDMLLRIVESK